MYNLNTSLWIKASAKCINVNVIRRTSTPNYKKKSTALKLGVQHISNISGVAQKSSLFHYKNVVDYKALDDFSA